MKRDGFVQTAVSWVERPLRHFPAVYRLASRALYRFDRSFYTLSPGLPLALQRAMSTLAASGLLGKTDYYEFGIFRGYGLYAAQKAARDLGAAAMRFWGFDSFRGLPAVDGVDEGGSMFFEGQFSCSRHFAERALRDSGADMQTITLVEGFFADSLTPELRLRHSFKPVGVALIDCDLYSSTVPVLAWLADLLRPGSMLMMDDWHAFGDEPSKGQQLALSEWLQSRPDAALEHMFDFGAHGRAFSVRAIANPAATGNGIPEWRG
jgi:hypothetical protein